MLVVIYIFTIKPIIPGKIPLFAGNVHICMIQTKFLPQIQKIPRKI